MTRKGIILMVLLGTLCVRADDFVPRQPTEARFDLYAVAGVAGLEGGEIAEGQGIASRPSWMKPADQVRSYSVTFPIVSFASNSVLFRFTPQSSGRVTLSLLGPYERVPGGKDGAFKQEVIWDTLQATGANLVGESGALLQLPVRSWLRQRYELGLQVTAQTPVSLRLAARAGESSSEPLMKPLAHHKDSPITFPAGFQRGVRIIRGPELLRTDVGDRELSERDFVRIREEGFDHVRLNLPWAQVCGPAPDFAIDHNVLGRLDLLANWAWKADLALTLGCPQAGDLTTDAIRELPRFIALWTALAKHFSNIPPSRLAFELVSPGGDKGSTLSLNTLYSETLKSIRPLSPGRWIFVTPGRGGSPAEMDRLRLPDNDDRILVVLQTREPEFFTQQATLGLRTHGVASIRFPGPPVEPLRLSSESTLDPNLRETLRRYQTNPASENPSGESGLEACVAFASRWASHYGRAVSFVDIGCSRALDSDSRSRYYTACRVVLGHYGLPWSMGDWKQEFRYWDPAQQRPMPGLRAALFPGSKAAAPEAVMKEITPTVGAKDPSAVSAPEVIKPNASADTPVSLPWAKAIAELQERSEWNWRMTRWTLMAMLGISVLILLLSVFRSRPAVEIVTTTRVLARQGLSSKDREDAVTLGRVTELLKEKLVLHLLASRRAGQLVQQQAAEEVADMERRLEQLHAPLQDKLHTYERRIAELERDLAKMGEQNRDLIRAKIEMTKQRITAPPRAVRPEELN